MKTPKKLVADMISEDRVCPACGGSGKGPGASPRTGRRMSCGTCYGTGEI
jgi:DnaJ-class molecular chaperone